MKVESSQAPSLSQLCALHYATIIGDGRVPPINSTLPTCVGDDIMNAMCKLGLLSEKGLIAFSKTPLEITKFDSSGCGLLQPVSLSKLQKYKLISINMSSTHVDKYVQNPFNPFNLEQFVSLCLNEESSLLLRHLNISGTVKILNPHKFAAIPNLVSLNVSRRPVCAKFMFTAVKHLSSLKFLDISETNVNDISWLAAIPNLETLIMYNIEIKKGDVKNDLSKLHKLQVLDISRKVLDFATDESQAPYADVSSVFVDLIKASPQTPWPNLRCLDISGNLLAGLGLDQAFQILAVIVDKSPKLKAISVLATPLDQHYFSKFGEDDVNVIHCASREKQLEALEYYWNTDRDNFTSHILHAVYYELQSSYERYSDEDIIRCAELVCKSMKRHLHNINVQMAGSACLYHLCKMKRIRRLSSTLVKNCMNRCLDAAETWRAMVQLQKNVWLTICNDYLLQLPEVDFYRTCKVALESMLISKDSSVARMTIAIVSIVTPKMKPPEARELTGDDRYVKFLVGQLEEHLRQLLNGPPADNSLFTLKFTLSALWNLTDESSRTCEVFHAAGGVAICFRILKSVTEHYNIQTKVLGILNNIAEVNELRHLLAKNEEYVGLLCACLEGEFCLKDENGRNRAVERSYFAAGVLSNLLSGSGVMELDDIASNFRINECLRRAVMCWPQLEGAMVSYRSFAPFARILETTHFDGARLWCLWGILHVLSNKDYTTHNSSVSYVEMALESSIPRICSQLACAEDIVTANLAQEINRIIQQDAT